MGFVLVLSRKIKNQTLTWGLIRILIWSRRFSHGGHRSRRAYSIGMTTRLLFIVVSAEHEGLKLMHVSQP